MSTAAALKAESHMRAIHLPRGFAMFSLISQMMFSDWVLPRECLCLSRPRLSCPDSPTWCPFALARNHQVLFASFSNLMCFNLKCLFKLFSAVIESVNQQQELTPHTSICVGTREFSHFILPLLSSLYLMTLCRSRQSLQMYFMFTLYWLVMGVCLHYS